MRTEKPDSGGDRFRRVMDFMEAVTATNAREDDYVPVVMINGERYNIGQVTWDPATENMIIEPIYPET